MTKPKPKPIQITEQFCLLPSFPSVFVGNPSLTAKRLNNNDYLLKADSQ
ncbi:MAG: hypothetical protein LBV16_02990 [Elusimicrobiota bacterium]|nr:hypothetical protein [Elusimicrobiota bacterium]